MKSLESQGLKLMESTGKDFDPELHEALTKVPAPSDDLKGKVIDTIEQGYYLRDKIIRYAKVVVEINDLIRNGKKRLLRSPGSRKGCIQR